MKRFTKLKPGLYLVHDKDSFADAMRDFTYPAMTSRMKPSVIPDNYPVLVCLTVGYSQDMYYMDVKFLRVDALLAQLSAYPHTK